MAKTIIKGVNEEDGTLITESKSTPQLITELIDALPSLCEADIQHGLEEIRLSSEQDIRIKKWFGKQLAKLDPNFKKSVSDLKNEVEKKMVEEAIKRKA